MRERLGLWRTGSEYGTRGTQQASGWLGAVYRTLREGQKTGVHHEDGPQPLDRRPLLT